MATPRHSSLWDRITSTGLEYTGLTPAEWEAWLTTNYPDAIARDVDGYYINPHDDPRSWRVTPARLSDTAWAFLRGQLSAVQVQEFFSLSDHELLQLADVRDWILTPNQEVAQQARLQDFGVAMTLVERKYYTNKTAIYTFFGIRDDVASG